MSAAITELAAIGLKAIKVQIATEVRRAAVASRRTALEDWKVAHGIHGYIPAGHPLLARMLEEVGASPAGLARSRAKRNEKNARARLERATRKALATSTKVAEYRLVEGEVSGAVAA